MTISGQEVYQFLKHVYPNADIYVLDEEYDVPTRDEVEKYYKNFITRMATARLTAWIKNVGDCDKWAWLLKASVTTRNWLSKQKNAEPFGLLCYFQGGDKDRGHAINNAIWREGMARRLQEIEPQPRGGILKLTQAERESAWLVIV